MDFAGRVPDAEHRHISRAKTEMVRLFVVIFSKEFSIINANTCVVLYLQICIGNYKYVICMYILCLQYSF